MSRSKILWCLLIASITLYYTTKEKTPEEIFEGALNDPYGEDSPNFCSTLRQLKDLNYLYSEENIHKVFSGRNKKLIACYMKRVDYFGSRHNESLAHYLSKTFLSQDTGKIKRLINDGVDPNFKIIDGISFKIRSAYYIHSAGTKSVSIKKQAPLGRDSSYSGRPPGSTYTSKIKLQNTTSIPVSYPDVLKTKNEIELYLESLDRPTEDLAVPLNRVPHYTTPLDMAIDKNNLPLVKILITYGADISKTEWSKEPTLEKKKDDAYSFLILKNGNWNKLEKSIIQDNVIAFKENITSVEQVKALKNAVGFAFQHHSLNILSELIDREEFDFIKKDWIYLLNAYQTESPEILTLLINNNTNLDFKIPATSLPKEFIESYNFPPQNRQNTKARSRCFHFRTRLEKPKVFTSQNHRVTLILLVRYS